MARGRLTSYSPHHPDVISVPPGALDRSPEEVRAARISALYREEKRGPPKIENRNTIGPAASLREMILRSSLFPNIFNRSTIKSSD
jgi:hypothetical protein